MCPRRHARCSSSPSSSSSIRPALSLAVAVSFLTAEYEPTFFFWELVEVLKKLLLVGVMSVVVPGTINQLVVGFLIALSFNAVLMVARPYR